MIHAVGFDLDETLLHRSASLLRFIRWQHGRHRLIHRNIPLQPWCDRFIEWDRRGYVSKDVVYTQLIDHFSLEDISAEQLLAEYRAQFYRHCVTMPQSRSLLRQLQAQGIHTFLITNGETRFQMKNAEAIGILPLFHVVLVSAQEGRKKPDPALFLEAAQRLQVPPEACLFVGDHPYNDIHGAAAVGMKTAWLQNTADWPRDLSPPDWTLQRLADLYSIMNDLSSVSALKSP